MKETNVLGGKNAVVVVAPPQRRRQRTDI